MEVKTMAKLIECGLKRRLTGKEGRDMEKKGGWKSIITTGIVSKGFGKFINLRWICNSGAISGQPEGRTDWITGWVKV